MRGSMRIWNGHKIQDGTWMKYVIGMRYAMGHEIWDEA
jgi:hypothetical protein